MAEVIHIAGKPSVAAQQLHLEEAIRTHEQITAYMMQNGYYHPYQIHEQIQLDLSNSRTALNIPS